LKGTQKTVLVIVLLLVIQAYCDLSLPSYTSDILNVGLQQNGIIHVSPETVRDSSIKDLGLFMPDEEYERIEAAYGEPDSDGVRSLNEDADLEETDRILMLPEAVLFQMQMSDSSQMSLPAVRLALNTGIMTKESLLKQVSEKMSGAGDMTDTYLRQIAVSYVASEYKAQGRDLTKIQNRYLLQVGLKMMLMALLMTVTAVLTGLLASRVSAEVGRRLRESIYDKVMKFTNAEMEKFSTASLITRSTNDIQQVQFVIVMLLRIGAYAPILAVFGIVKVVQTRSGMSWI
jgi:ATP-binding cassette subfamily B protein